MTSLLTDRRLRSWLSGAVLTTWSLTRSKLWRCSWTSGETPTRSPPTYHHEQHCDCSGVIQLHGQHHLPGPEVGQSHWVHCEKGPAETVLPSPAEEVQPATGTAETVLICHHWIRPLHINNCLVQLSYQIWPQKTTEGSPNCWANHWYILPTLQELYSSRVSKRAVKITLDPSHPAHSLFELFDATELWAPERPDTETISSLKQSISWTLDINYGTHTIYTLIYLTHILSLHFNCT